MSNALQGINDRTSKVVDGVDFVLCPGTMMRSWVAAVNDRISKSFVLVVDRDFGSNTVHSSLSR